MGNKSSASEPIGNNGAPKNVINIYLINVISQIYFHLYLVGNGNDDISSEEHFKIQNQ
jgi:hypothetical protein